MAMPAEWHNARFERHERIARAAFAEQADLAALGIREAEIDALPEVDFQGRHLVALICIACGRQRNVSRAVAWSLMSIRHYTCEWCALHGGSTKPQEAAHDPHV